MATRKTNAKSPVRRKTIANGTSRPQRNPIPSAQFTSENWARVSGLSMALDALATDLGLYLQDRDEDGFDLTDAASELARLALNYNRELILDRRSAGQEKEDWISVGGIGADLGNMANDEPNPRIAQGMRTAAFELCYLTCDYLF